MGRGQCLDTNLTSLLSKKEADINLKRAAAAGGGGAAGAGAAHGML
jgi:hypothetical protein